MKKPLLSILLAFFLFKGAYAQQKKNPVLTFEEQTISWAGMRVDLNTDGLPAMIRIDSGKVFTEPVHFHTVKASNHKDVKWQSSALIFSKKQPNLAKWSVTNMADSLKMTVTGTIKPDGNLLYQINVTALADINLDNIRLHLPFNPEAAKFVRTPGLERTLRPDLVDWKWDANKEMQATWLGNDLCGLTFKLTDAKHHAVPESWANHGQGGYTIAQKGKAILMDGYSGTHSLKKGEVQDYSFELILNSGVVAAR